MEDKHIVELYWARNESAIQETATKYGNYCFSIAYTILNDRPDAEECVNDTYLDVWKVIPPNRPSNLATFMAKITRRIAIDRCRIRSAQKRGGDGVTLALEELDECVRGSHDVESKVQYQEMVAVIQQFIGTLSETERRIFLLRYWYLESTQSISERYGFSQSKVLSMLHRIRGKLRKRLEKEGYL